METDISELKGVGATSIGLLARLNIRTVEDLINHYPRRYDDFSHVSTIANASAGKVTIKAKLSSVKGKYGRSRGLHITEALASDSSGKLRVTWFNQPYRAASIKPGKEYYLSGVFDFSGSYLSLVNPSIELADSFKINTARILPIYKETKGLTSKKLRSLMKHVLPILRDTPEDLPQESVKLGALDPLHLSLQKLHFPKNSDDIQKSRRDLGVRELFEVMLASQLLRKDIQQYRSPRVPINEALLKKLSAGLPFKLTDQQRVITWRILKDMQDATHPMNRLVEGDVGSGKTVIAGLVAANAVDSGGQVALMAPTELLAKQHLASLSEQFASVLPKMRIELLIGSLPAKDKKKILSELAKGDIDILIGTHAIFQRSVEFHKLELVILDEQHRFGVEQRKQLLRKAKLMPHVLSLTATPIPRTLSLVVYGELDVSVLSEKPPGRKEITTELVSLASRAEKLKELVEQSSANNQAYIVCPHIEDKQEQISVEEIYKLVTSLSKSAQVDIMHGKLTADEKEHVMSKFLSGETHVLVSTTVIEVGVNAVNAHVMAIIAPERFGLAQLHQLRGRVGRGNQPGHCYLLRQDNKPPPKRISYMCTINDGFKLSELDLHLRGPGAIYGTRQSGLLDLRLADISDTKQLFTAKDMAVDFVRSDRNMVKYRRLNARVLSIQKVTNLN